MQVIMVQTTQAAHPVLRVLVRHILVQMHPVVHRVQMVIHITQRLVKRLRAHAKFSALQVHVLRQQMQNVHHHQVVGTHRVPQLQIMAM
jgi:hypothetical protein